MKDRIQRFLRSDNGVSSIEYALLGSLISAVIVVAVTAVGDEIARIYNNVKDQVLAALS